MSAPRPMPHGDAIEELVIEQMRTDIRRRRPQARRRRVAAWSFATAAAVIVTAVVVAVPLFVTPTPSYAATPPMLQVSKTEEVDAAQLLTRLSERVRESGGPTASDLPETQHIDIRIWGLSAHPGTGLPTTVEPENHSITRHADGSWTQVVTAGEPYDANGNPVDDPNAPAPGTELWRTEHGAGEHGYLFPDSIPETGAELREVIIGVGMGDTSDPNEWVSLVNALMTERLLTAGQQAAVLEVLATLDLEVAGTTFDRLGREANVLQTRAAGRQYVDRVLVNDTGHIIATETIYVGDVRTDITAPAVVSYAAWEGQT